MTSNVSSSLDGDLVWSSRNYKMREFVESFQDSMPVLVKTTAGYAGFDEGMHQIGSGEVYLVCGIQRQKRLVVQPEKSSCYLSIPTEYPIKVQITLKEGNKKVGPPVPISEVVDVFYKSSSEVKLMFEKNQPVSFQIGADLGSTAKLGVLTVIQTYEEKYLLANTIYGRSIFPQSQGIPVYLPVEFVTAESLKVGGTRALKGWMKDVMDAMKTHKKEPVKMCQELILFSERPSGGEYDYIRLTDLSNFKAKDKIYAELVIKPQNPYDTDPNRPKLPGLRPSRMAQRVAPNQNQSFALPRFPAPNPCADKPGPTGGTTSAPTKHTLPPGSAGGHLPLAPSRTGTKSSPRPTPPTPGNGSHPERTTPSLGGVPSSSYSDQGNYEQLGPASPPSGGIYESLSEIPTHEDFGKLTIEQVVDCLRLLRLGHHAETFRTRYVDGKMAQCLTEEMLVKEFDFRSFDAIQFVMFAKDGWRPK